MTAAAVLDAPPVLGSTMPRLFTPPLMAGPPGPCGCGCALTAETSYGFEVDGFARDTLRVPLDPWERWAVIHAGELLPDGSPRFAIVLILVARQNGKTHLLVVLTLYWLFRARLAMVLGTSTKLDYARESWLKAVKLAKSIPGLRAGIPARGGVRKANGEQELVYAPSGDVDDLDACRYKIAASNEEGGRSLTIDRLILDELRQHDSYDAWDAAEPTVSAVDGSQIWGLSNAGSVKSIVLNDLQDDARALIEWWDRESGERGVAELLADPDMPGDYRTGLFEWSSPEDADPTDVYALAQANPNMGLRKDAEKLIAAGRRAVRLGGKALTGFKTEHMCIRVKLLNPAIDPTAWADGLLVGGLDDVRKRVAMVWDVAPDLLHVALYAAAVLPDGRVRVDSVKAWEGPGCTKVARRELPALIGRTRPRALGWLPNGPGAALAADMKPRPGVWPPPGVQLEEIKAEVPAVCMGFDELVTSRQIVHSGDPLLDSQVEGAEWLKVGDRKVFSRRGEGHVNAVYAAAGAAHLARTLPADPGPFRIR